ncbi:MAG: Flp pilus assembly protein CpaB [Oscillospiraceae bacterium]
MLKNRTLIGIILIVAAIGLCFGISPLFNKILASKTTIIRLKQDVPQGAQITGAMLEAVEVGTLNLPTDMQNNPQEIIGKYTVAAMFKGDTFTNAKLSAEIDNSDNLLRQLKPNETAMSVTIKSLANGLSGKLRQGDIIQIVSVDEDDVSQIYEELQYVEVLATTTDSGSDDVYKDGEVNAEKDDEEQSLYATVTLVLQDRAQALKLAECENTSLHAVFVTRGDEEYKQKCLKAQLDLLSGENEENPDTPNESDINESEVEE